MSPYELFFGTKARICRYRVLFCPCVVNVDQRQDMDIGTQLNCRNNPERGIRGVHVGLPHNSAGWLVYIPSTGCVLVSSDVVFDEDFFPLWLILKVVFLEVFYINLLLILLFDPLMT